MSHHEYEREMDLLKRFQQQMDGTARREYPKGRMGHEDDGQLTYAVAVDRRHQAVVIRFGKPVEWVGLGVEDLKELIAKLGEAMIELQTGDDPRPPNPPGNEKLREWA